MTKSAQSAPSRLPFPAELQSTRDELLQLLPLLETQEGWYGSIYFERKQSRSFSVNLKQSQRADHLSLGAVLRIYDGYSLYEEATDDFNLEQMKKAANQLVQRVISKRQWNSSGAKYRPYQPPTWKQRLSSSQALDPEITSQIPEKLTAKTPVHFGIRIRESVEDLDSEECFRRLKNLIQRSQELAPSADLSVDDLSYILSRLNLVQEDSIFLDRETNMSQSLNRISLSLVLMSGSEKTFSRVGGLGGLEAIELPETEITELLRDLKSLKNSKRLIPGKYRVIFGPAVAGVLAHEAFGHSQEGDTCARGRSKAWELHQSGEPVGNANATILNNPALFQNGDKDFGAWGSYFFDEEGWLAQEQVLLEHGKLKAPMTNLTSALRLGVSRTANGKRENWAHGVYTRQTNTYFSAGEKTLAELMEELQDGFFVTQAAGGMEDPKGMGIQVGLAYLHEVKNGKLTGTVFKGPAGGDIQLTGYTPDVLNSIISKSKIEALSDQKDRAKHPFNDVGGCGKYHKEFVYAGCGGPYLLLDQVILG